jgi:hypothetical protein
MEMHKYLIKLLKEQPNAEGREEVCTSNEKFGLENYLIRKIFKHPQEVCA